MIQHINLNLIMKEQFEEVKKLLMEYADRGTQIFNDKVLLIGYAPEIGSEAWLHEIYNPLSNEDIQTIENECYNILPNSYKQFLMECSNGLSCFITKLNLYGLSKMSGRSVEAVRQPFSIIDANTFRLPDNATKKEFYIGRFGADGSIVYMNKETEKVYRCDRDDAFKIITEWDNLFDLLISEIKRLSIEFNNKYSSK